MKGYAIKHKFSNKYWNIYANDWETDIYSASITKGGLEQFIDFYNMFGGEFDKMFEIVAFDVFEKEKHITAKEILGLPLTTEENNFKRRFIDYEQIRTITRT